MKKIIFVLFFALLLINFIPSFSESQVSVYVGIADQYGNLVVKNEKITVTDLDNDGKITGIDAMIKAHDDCYPGEDGFYGADTVYGFTIYKLWGVANGGSYGCYINNAYDVLDKEMHDNDYIYAFIYQDLDFWSDSYTYFDCLELETNVGDQVTFSLSKLGFDEIWNIINDPPVGAKIYDNGVNTGITSDENGQFTINFSTPGTHILTFESESEILTPNQCIVEVHENPTTYDNGIFLLIVTIAIALVLLKVKIYS